MIATSAEQQTQVSREIGRNIETIAHSVEQNSNAAQESAEIARHLAKLAQIVAH
jgi:methyl-accepting chemotaxis protein